MSTLEPLEPLQTASSVFFDHSKIPCKEHTNEPLINFCLNPQCMIALCATCICSHTEMHVRERTAPKYTSIKELKKATLQELNEHLKTFGEVKERITQIIISTEDAKRQLKDTLMTAKQQVYDTIDKTFDMLYDSFEENIEKRKKVGGIMSVSELELISKKVTKKMKDLVEEGQELNSMVRFLQTTKKFKSELFSDSQKFLKDVTGQIYQTEKFKYDLKYSKEMVLNLTTQIQKVFCLDFKFSNLGESAHCQPVIAQNNVTRNSVVMPQVIKIINNRQSSMSKPVMKRQSSQILPFQCVENLVKTATPVQHNRIPSNLISSIVYQKPLGSSRIGSKWTQKIQGKDSYGDFSTKMSDMRLSNSFSSSQFTDFLMKRSNKENE